MMPEIPEWLIEFVLEHWLGMVVGGALAALYNFLFPYRKLKKQFNQSQNAPQVNVNINQRTLPSDLSELKRLLSAQTPPPDVTDLLRHLTQGEFPLGDDDCPDSE